jgi:enoyl-CoA hydratase/carnithine racemase
MSSEFRIKTQITDGVADVRLARPDKMNALDLAMFEALVAEAASLSANRDVRAVVLSGEGRAFCAGIDMTALQAFDAPSEKDRIRLRAFGEANIYQQAVLAWRELPVPVIAAVHGVAFGGGFQIMLGADMRYVAPDTKLSIMEIQWGLIPDMAGTVLMPQLARDDIIRELSYSGRVFLGDEAASLGFATRSCEEPLAAALTMARTVAEKSPDAIRAMKALFNAAPAASRADQLLAESEWQIALMNGKNHKEAVASGLEKRAPNFTKLS